MVTDLLLGARRLLHESARTQIRERVDDLKRRESRDALPAHRHHNHTAIGGVSHISAELVVQLPHADLCLQLRTMWRHGRKHRRYIELRQEPPRLPAPCCKSLASRTRGHCAETAAM